MSLRTPSTTEELSVGIARIHELVSDRQRWLNELKAGIRTPGIQQEALDRFLETIGLEKNDETRYAAFMRLANLKTDGLVNYFTAQKKSRAEINTLLEGAYTPVATHHTALHENLIETIEAE